MIVTHNKGDCQVVNKLFHAGITEADFTDAERLNWGLLVSLKKQATEAGDTERASQMTDTLIKMIEVAEKRKH